MMDPEDLRSELLSLRRLYGLLVNDQQRVSENVSLFASVCRTLLQTLIWYSYKLKIRFCSNTFAFYKNESFDANWFIKNLTDSLVIFFPLQHLCMFLCSFIFHMLTNRSLDLYLFWNSWTRMQDNYY